MTLSLLLEADSTMTVSGFRENAANLVFCGTFLLAIIGVAVWWLRKG